MDIFEYFGDKRFTSGNFYGGYGADLKTDARVHYDVKSEKFDFSQQGIENSKYNRDEYTKPLDEFHRFGLLWTEEEYVFYYDEKETARTSGPISGVEQFILLTTEVQGYRRGDGTKHAPEAEQSLDDTFVVDYVRVFDRI